MSKDKIDVISKYFYPVAGGIEINTLQVYSALVQSGWKVTIHTSTDTLTRKNILPKNEIINGIKIKRYRFKSDFYGYNPKIDWQKTNVIALHNFNVSHFRILIKALYLKIVGLKSFTLIVTPHGGFNPQWSTFPWISRITKYIYQYFLGTLISNIVVDKFRAVSVWEKEQMIKKGILANKIQVITNGLEEEAYLNTKKLASKSIKSKVKKYGKYIIQIARIHPIKNFETVIKALPLIDKKVKFVIVGEIADAKYYKYLEMLIGQLSLKERVVFAGIVRGIDKYYLIKKSIAMVHMAIWESFCNTVNEALSQGVLCIVANNTALKYLINKDFGFLIKTRDSLKLSKIINYIIDNPKLEKLKRMRKTGMLKSKQQSWKNVANIFEKMIIDTQTINMNDKK